MEKTSVANPKVRCGTCRMFDGYTWCRRWNFYTSADSPPCRFYKRAPKNPGPPPSASAVTG